MCRVGVSNEGRCSVIELGLSNDCKWVFNKACNMPWCHAVGVFEVKESHFGAVFQDHRPDRSRTFPKQAVFFSR